MPSNAETEYVLPARDVASQTMNLKTHAKIRLRRKLKNANLKIKRRNVKLLSMKYLVKHLKQNNKYSSTIKDVLMNNFEGFQLDLVPQ